MQNIDLYWGAWACTDSKGTSGQSVLFLTPEKPVVENVLLMLKLSKDWKEIAKIENNVSVH